MASITRRLLLQSRQCPSRIRSQVTSSSCTQWQRPLSTTAPRLADDDGRSAVQERRVRAPIQTGKITNEEKQKLSANLGAALSALDPEVIKGAQRGRDFEIDQDMDFREQPKKLMKSEVGFWAEGEQELGKDEDYFGDDLTSDGHQQLQEHRELREYARLIAWELPLLSRTSSYS
jgi:small subunit ribosomal protein S35